MLDMYERFFERKQERANQEAADKLNKTLFGLTVATVIFAPVQFIAGVYGMNFVDANGTPTIPELLSGNGYFKFWLGTGIYLVLSTFLAVCLFRRLHSKGLYNTDGDATICNDWVLKNSGQRISKRRRLRTRKFSS